MKVDIYIDGVLRVFRGDYDELHMNDWNDIMQKFLDDVREWEGEELPY